MIDLQLQAAGWEADSVLLDYRKGARPEKGTNRADCRGGHGRWPCRLSAVCRSDAAGRGRGQEEPINVAGKIAQAERYSRGLKLAAPLTAAWKLAGRSEAWADEAQGHYQVPFVYSCNGRPYVPQLAEQSGTWFRDVREPGNLKRALPSFHTPEGLLDRLKRSKEEAELKLQQEPFGYLKLRDYQQKAIAAVENTLAQDITPEPCWPWLPAPARLIAIIGLMYRFLKAERFKRILFLVDRTALGHQAQEAFHEALLEQNFSLSKIYNVAELGDMAAEAETRIQVATVQAMVKRVFMSDNPPPVDQFDCIIVDEAHRGYTLDGEMTEGELATRDAAQYLSSYRRVLEYFDAVRLR